MPDEDLDALARGASEDQKTRAALVRHAHQSVRIPHPAQPRAPDGRPIDFLQERQLTTGWIVGTCWRIPTW
ncbi:hypothetical protein GCM10010222_76570 [Streptomyces tanashiensis]|nr:hypothetical protein GCM10010222_76570 [Streptomyces tanashiensis]